MVCTSPTSQPLRSASKAAAPLNIARMLMTAETSHAEMSPLKASAPAMSPLVCGQLFASAPSSMWHCQLAQNSPDMSVTRDTSQSEMCPYAASAPPASASHASTAVLIESLSKPVSAPTASAHSLAPSLLKEPAGHSTGCDALPAQLEPAGHGKHSCTAAIP